MGGVRGWVWVGAWVGIGWGAWVGMGWCVGGYMGGVRGRHPA